MVRDIIAEVYPWELRVAIAEEDKLVEVFWADQGEKVGNIYKGRVKDVLPGLSCAFVDIGLAKNAFLYLGDVAISSDQKACGPNAILKSGQEIMVQVKKEAFSEKGAKVTGDISLPGRFLVLLPFQTEVSISRKIVGNNKRADLRRLIEENKPDNVGVILRTACLNAEDKEIIAELGELLRLWLEIRERYERSKAPRLIYEDLDVMERALRDYLDGHIRKVIINNQKLKERINQFIRQNNFPTDFQVQYIEGDLFERFGLEKYLRKALRRKVWLKSGGYLVFDQTEALTVIDVNSGKFTGKDDFEETVHQLNVEAAQEIARQLRLRSIGGIILIDFIDMKNKDNQEEVVEVLRQELEKDKAHTCIIGMTGLGFLEMTRKKSRYGVSEVFTEECSTCHGWGRTINVSALACEIKRKLANLGYLESEELICEIHPRVFEALRAEEKDLDYIRKKTGKRIKFIPNSELGWQDYNISTGES